MLSMQQENSTAHNMPKPKYAGNTFDPVRHMEAVSNIGARFNREDAEKAADRGVQKLKEDYLGKKERE